MKQLQFGRQNAWKKYPKMQKYVFLVILTKLVQMTTYEHFSRVSQNYIFFLIHKFFSKMRKIEKLEKCFTFKRFYQASEINCI